jgi:hypothetical protein
LLRFGFGEFTTCGEKTRRWGPIYADLILSDPEILKLAKQLGELD